MMRHAPLWRRWWWMPLLATGCLHAPEPVPARARLDLLQVVIAFDPPLAEPGVLVARHECGHHWRGQVRATGVTIRLPAGPASLLLTRANGDEHARALVVAAGMTDVLWSWRRDT